MLKSLAISGGLFLINYNSKEVNMSIERLNVARHAVCYLFPRDSEVHGVVSFTQENFGAKTQIAAVIRGLQPNQLHGLHIHEYGDYQNQGQIFNPHNKRHGSPQDKERKLGDMGNIKCDERGNGYLAYEDSHVQLYGEFSVLGRSVCVKAEEDDLGRGGNPNSLIDGNAGKTLASGVIALSDTFKNLPPH